MKRLAYRPLTNGLIDELFNRKHPAWIDALRDKSGVYVIRQRDGGRVLYVGESHSDRLKDTLTRHFRAWSGPTAGPVYSRGAVEIAVVITPKARAVARQNALICRLKPRDNELRTGCPLREPPGEVPF